MKIIVSLTTIPPRFEYIPEVIIGLKKLVDIGEIWLNVPRVYKRFPDWDGTVPWSGDDLGITLNRDCEDVGPGTAAFGPLGKTEASIVIIVDDDTTYPDGLIPSLWECHSEDGCSSAWGLSGFNFDTYMVGQYPREHKMRVDVLEGYGGCLYRMEWLDMIFEEYKDLLDVTTADDMLISNLLTKHGIDRYTMKLDDCNLSHLKQLDYGFKDDAFHNMIAGGSHVKNNMRILDQLEKIGKKYFTYHHPRISYAITVCNESISLYSLLSFLKKVKDPNDEINILVDSLHCTENVRRVLDAFRDDIITNDRAFCGDFAVHRNHHLSLCSGDYIFVIDADEMPTELLIKNIKQFLTSDNELIMVPRVNIHPGFTLEWLQRNNFSMNEVGWVNWPDFIGRVFKNEPDRIKYSSSLHERIEGAVGVAELEKHPGAAVWHIKSVDKQDNRWDSNGNFISPGTGLYDGLM